MHWLRERLRRLKLWLIAGGPNVDLLGYVAVLAVALTVQNMNGFQYAEWKLYDQSLRWLRTLTHQPVANDVVIIAADEASFQAFDEPFALWHKHLGTLVDAMVTAQPAVVGLDIVLPAKSYESVVPGIDRELMAPLLRARGQLNLVVAQTLDEQLQPRPIFPGFVALLGADRLASALLCFDEDSVVRRIMSAQCGAAEAHRGIAERMAAVLGAPPRAEGLIDFRYGLPFPTLSLAQVERWQAEGNSAQLRVAFAGKAVLVGVVLPLEDRLKAPVGLLASEPDNRRIPGVLMHAQILRSLLNHGFIQPVPAWVVALLTALVCLCWFGYGYKKNLIYWTLFALLPLLGLYALWLGHALPPAALLVSAKLAYAARQALEAMRIKHHRLRLTQAFAGHVDGRLLQRMLAGDAGNGGDLMPQRQAMTALWVRLPVDHGVWMQGTPEAAAEALGTYYTAVRTAVQRAGGMIERFHGAQVLAYFGAPLPLRHAPRAALEAALAIVRSYPEWSRRIAGDSTQAPKVAIGIASGEVLAGQVTLPGASPFVVLGETVERASGLATQALDNDTQVLVDPATAQAVAAKGLEQVQVAGVEAYKLIKR